MPSRLQQQAGWHARRFLFENDAADESLPPEHWFWDRSLSGGIFVEHGVHFFDVAHMFLDAPAQQVVAAETRRDGWPAPDLVSATVVHGDALATHTHSFTHLHRAERQLMRLDFGSAEVRIDGWIPVSAELVAYTDAAGEATIRAVLEEPGLLEIPGVQLPERPVVVDATDASGTGLTDRPDATRRVTARLTLGGEPAKQSVYAAGVAAALADLHACRADATRRPRSNADTAAAAVTVAELATRAAGSGRAQTIDPNEVRQSAPAR
jgi:predicted dehydrogenase